MLYSLWSSYNVDITSGLFMTTFVWVYVLQLLWIFCLFSKTKLFFYYWVFIHKNFQYYIHICYSFFVVIFQVHFKYQGKYFVIIGAWNPVNGDILLEYSKLGGEKKGKSKLLHLYSLFSLFFWWRQYVRRFNDDTRSTMMDVLLNNKKGQEFFFEGAQKDSLCSRSPAQTL